MAKPWMENFHEYNGLRVAGRRPSPPLSEPWWTPAEIEFGMAAFEKCYRIDIDHDKKIVELEPRLDDFGLSPKTPLVREKAEELDVLNPDYTVFILLGGQRIDLSAKPSQSQAVPEPHIPSGGVDVARTAGRENSV